MTAFYKQLHRAVAFTAGDNTHLRELLHPDNGDPALGYSLAHASIAPGEHSLPHTLHGHSELYYILSGTGRASVAGVEYALQADDTLVVPAGAEQAVYNTGSIPLVFLCIVSPPWQAATETVAKE